MPVAICGRARACTSSQSSLTVAQNLAGWQLTLADGNNLKLSYLVPKVPFVTL